MNKEAGSNLVFFLLGAAVGAAVALLYAPQEGAETRRIITDNCPLSTVYCSRPPSVPCLILVYLW